MSVIAQAPRALVLRALGVGDLCTAVPALRALRRALPDHRIELAAPAALAPLTRLIDAVDLVHDTRPPPRRGPAAIDLPYAARGADVAVDLQGPGPESTAALRASGAAHLIAFGVDGLPPYRQGVHERDRWCLLLAAAGIPADPDDLRLPRPAAAVPAPAAGATLLHPGGASRSRRWPVAKWAAVARVQRSAGRRVVLTGSAAERDLCLEVARRAGLSDGAVLAGETDLLGLAATVASVARVACGDTGVAHLATAFGVPSVVLFGPTPPDETGPPRSPRHRVLWSGRRGDPHGETVDPGLAAIEPRQVLRELATL